MNTDAPLLEAINRLADAILTGVPVDKRLWNSESCAQYLSITREHFLAHIACRPDFPHALHIGAGVSGKGRRWKAQDVIEWAESKRL
jgi:predicted DNA-binding transcriptional regulator AlpA